MKIIEYSEDEKRSPDDVQDVMDNMAKTTKWLPKGHDKPDGNLDESLASSAEDRYRNEVFRSPLLGEAEERDLVQRYREHGDISARDQIVLVFRKRLEAAAAEMFRCNRKSGVSKEELAAVGVATLVRALDTFDPSQGWRFGTYTYKAVPRAMLDFIKRNGKPTSGGHRAKKKTLTPAEALAQQSLNHERTVFRDGRARSNSGQVETTGSVLDYEQVGTESAAADDDARQVAFDSKRRQAERVSEGGPGQKANRRVLAARIAALDAAVKALPSLERRIFKARFLTNPKVTLEALGAKVGLGRERVRQIAEAANETVEADVRSRMGRGPAKKNVAPEEARKPPKTAASTAKTTKENYR